MRKRVLTIGLLCLAICGQAGAEAQDHPGIRQTITALKQAKETLEHGEHGFGGHRAKAIEHIDGAVRELQAALEYAQLHPSEVKAPGTP